VGNFLGGIGEHLYFNNGGIDRLLDHREGGLLFELSDKKNETPWEDRVERLYLAILSRRPTPEEMQKFVEYLNVEKDRVPERTREAMWTLMTCSEFRFNH
jgi:hypothetical protein